MKNLIAISLTTLTILGLLVLDYYFPSAANKYFLIGLLTRSIVNGWKSFYEDVKESVFIKYDSKVIDHKTQTKEAREYRHYINSLKYLDENQLLKVFLWSKFNRKKRDLFFKNVNIGVASQLAFNETIKNA